MTGTRWVMENPVRMLFRVGVSSERGEGAVELLGEHGASQFVREGERRKRKLLRGAPPQRLWKTFRTAAQKYDFARAPITRFSQPFRELRRGLIFFRIVQ